MTEPIRLWAVIDEDDSVAVDMGMALAFKTEKDAQDEKIDGDRVVELTEVRRCAMCAHYDSSRENPGWCTLLSFAVPVRGHCHMHDPLRTIDQAIAALGKGES